MTVLVSKRKGSVRGVEKSSHVLFRGRNLFCLPSGLTRNKKLVGTGGPSLVSLYLSVQSLSFLVSSVLLFSLSLSPCFSAPLSLSLSLSFSLSFPLSPYIYMYIYTKRKMPLFSFLSVCVWGCLFFSISILLCLPRSLSLSLLLCLPRALSLSLYISLYMSLVFSPLPLAVSLSPFLFLSISLCVAQFRE